jgi:hypothetical protein
MMLFKFMFLIFQNGRFTEELVTYQHFADYDQLILALVRFCAMQSSMRLSPKIRRIYMGSGPDINLPKAQDGYGPETFVVIKEITAL